MDTTHQGKINRQLILGFLAMISIFILFGLFAQYGIYTVSRYTRTLFEHPLYVSNAALKANVAITKMHRSMKDVVLFSSPLKIDLAIEEVAELEHQVYTYLDIVKDRIIGDEGMMLEKEARRIFTGWQPIRNEVINLIHDGRINEAAQITRGKGADYVEGLEHQMVGLADYARNKAVTFMDGSQKTYSRAILVSILFLLSGILTASIVAFITFKKIVGSEKELWESKQLLENAIDLAPIGMVLVTPAGNFYQANQAFCHMIGYTEQELQKMNFQDLTFPDDYHIGDGVVQKLIGGETRTAYIQKRYIKKNGSIIDVSLSTSILKNKTGTPLYFFTQIQDISESKKAKEQLESSLAEKTVLIKEVHHRVKNNLQLIHSLLNLQSACSKNEVITSALEDTRNRIFSMALIHERLYKEKDARLIDFKAYCEELLQNLLQSCYIPGRDIQINREIQSIQLDLDRAVSCGLIINELVTNSLKHAFVNMTHGKIDIRLIRLENDQLELTVSDNGIFKETVALGEQNQSFGLKLVEILAVEQLEGSYHIDTTDGFSSVIRIPSN